jgi:galactose-1-phosphate uridylyltransferase
MKIIKKIRNSLNYRKRYFYSKITRVYWMVISNILLSNKRDVRKKDILYVFVPVWGKWHISLFFQYTMPSLMQSNNLPAVSKEKKNNN